jgi:hypothetical protein
MELSTFQLESQNTCSKEKILDTEQQKSAVSNEESWEA